MRIELPDKRIVDVPDDWTPEQMMDAYKSLVSQETTAKPETTPLEEQVMPEIGADLGEAWEPMGKALHVLDTPFRYLREAVESGALKVLPDGQLIVVSPTRITAASREDVAKALGLGADVLAFEGLFRVGGALLSAGEQMAGKMGNWYKERLFTAEAKSEVAISQILKEEAALAELPLDELKDIRHIEAIPTMKGWQETLPKFKKRTNVELTDTPIEDIAYATKKELTGGREALVDFGNQRIRSAPEQVAEGVHPITPLPEPPPTSPRPKYPAIVGTTKIDGVAHPSIKIHTDSGRKEVIGRILDDTGAILDDTRYLDELARPGVADEVSPLIKRDLWKETGRKAPKPDPDIVKFYSGIHPDMFFEPIPESWKRFGRQTYKELAETIHSPLEAMRKDAVAFKELKFADMQDLGKISFQYREYEAFRKATKGVNEAGAERVGQWLDNRAKIRNLKERTKYYGLDDRELKAAKYLKERFGHYIQHWGRTYLAELGGDYNKVVKLASRGAKEADLAKLNEYETEVYNLLRSKFRDYLPHVWTGTWNKGARAELLAGFETTHTNLATKLTTETSARKQVIIQRRMDKLIAAIRDVKGGKPVTYDALPGNLRMKYFEPRMGKEGYTLNAFEAWRSYLNAYATKLFDEPVLRSLANNWDLIKPESRAYMQWFARDYMGWNRPPAGQLASTIRSFEWSRTIGANFRSPFGNFTQRIVNVIPEAGPIHSARGQMRAMKVPGKSRRALGFRSNSRDAQLWEASGIEAEVPQVLMAPVGEGKIAEGADKIRRTLGWMFQTIEEGNRKMSFFTGLEMYKHLPEGERILKAIELVHKTQFRYGRVGMPRILRGWGGTIFQFSSYPIKQFELIHKWTREGPKGALKIATHFGMALGIQYGLSELFDVDLSNYLGFGADFGEAYKTVESATKGEIEAAARHLELTFAKGTGMLPQGVGPAAQAIWDLPAIVNPHKGMMWWFKQHVAPIQYNRIVQALDAVKDEEDGRYPLYNRHTGERMYEVSKRQLIQSVFGPTPAEVAEKGQAHRGKVLAQRELQNFRRAIADAMTRGNTKQVNRILARVPDAGLPFVIPSEQGLQTAILRRGAPRELRDAFKTGQWRFYYEATK